MQLRISGKQDQAYFWMGMAAIALVSFGTRFWQLDGLATIVFDEVYYPKFAQDYLQGKPFFDAHPPLGKYIIALGIHIFGNNPFGYRFFTALAGALLPLVTCGLVYQLSDRPRWAVLAGWFTALDGLLLVESRYGLINIYLVLFGMLSQLCMLLALKQPRRRWMWAIATGIMFGCACSVKWSAVTYVVGLVAIAFIIWRQYNQRLSLVQVIICLILFPIGVYVMLWLPHLALNQPTGFWEVHQQMFGFHQNLGVGKTEPVHPYCSSWWTWPLMIRSIAYYYNASADNTIVNDVTALGNPFLYWLSTLAIILCLQLLIYRLWTWLEWHLIVRSADVQNIEAIASFSHLWQHLWQRRKLSWMPVYLVISFMGHFLPWSLTQRCTFLYHYMPASVFAFITLAIVTDWCLQQNILKFQRLGQAIVAIVTLSFILWLPIYLGLSITPQHFRFLMWFPSWI